MSDSKGKGFVVEAGLCRCCGHESECRLLNAEYSCVTQKEVYSDMFLDCFGLVLSNLDGESAERLICATCVTRLRDASQFRQQVLLCEEKLLTSYLQTQDDKIAIKQENTIKIEVDFEMSGNVEYVIPLESSQENTTHTNKLDNIILTFNNNRNLFEESRPSQDPALNQEESIASIRNSIYYLSSTQYDCKDSQEMFGTEVVNCTGSLTGKAHNCAKLSCSRCQFTRSSDIVRQKRTHTSEKSIACQLCDYKCNQNSSLVKHMRTHSGEKPFSCNMCDYKCTENSSLVSHIRTHTGEKPFSCKLCNYKCTKKSNLVRHYSTHTGVKPFSCKLCKYKCTANSKLVTHMRKHTGEKPFACKLCSYKCTEKGSLVKHTRTHSSEKPFACKLCKYKSTDNSKFVTHMRTHTGEKPFNCKLCRYKCTQSSSLASHMRTHTGEKPFSCKLCKYKCTQSSNLVRHMKTHTNM